MTEQSVRSLLDARIDGSIESVVWYRSRGSAHYALVTALRDNETVGITTVLLDTDDDSLRVLDNSMWLPAESAILDAAIRSLARTTNRIEDSIEDDGAMRESLLTWGVDEVESYRIDDEYDPDADEDWKAREGADEMLRVRERLDEAGIEPVDRFVRLAWGGKAPWEGEPQRIMRSPDDIAGNYGIEVDPDDDLVILDVDDLDDAPLDRLPSTLRSESPHGGEHLFYRVPGWRDEFRDRFGVENPHTSFGEVRSGDGYVVGPGSELTDCKHGCCSEDDPGEYDLVDDLPITTMKASILSDLLAPFREGSDA
jgi:hypothetical protein